MLARWSWFSPGSAGRRLHLCGPRTGTERGDPRIRWHNLPENAGNQAGPNQAGLQLARGRYVAYMHQADLWLPCHVGALVEALEGAAA